MDEVTGGCACGRVRFAVAIEDDDAAVCHCRMCQRASGGAFSAMKGVRIAGLRWTGPVPDYYASSPIARRGYCAACGSPLSFEYVEGSDRIDLMLAAFDDPARFRPTQQFAIESRHDAWCDVLALPGERTEESAELVDRWMTACGKLPE